MIALGDLVLMTLLTLQISRYQIEIEGYPSSRVDMEIIRKNVTGLMLYENIYKMKMLIWESIVHQGEH